LLKPSTINNFFLDLFLSRILFYFFYFIFLKSFLSKIKTVSIYFFIYIINIINYNDKCIFVPEVRSRNSSSSPSPTDTIATINRPPSPIAATPGHPRRSHCPSLPAPFEPETETQPTPTTHKPTTPKAVDFSKSSGFSQPSLPNMVTCISNMYEAARNQQVERNKRKFELFLTNLSCRHFLAKSRRGKGFFFIGFVVVGSLLCR
jgi:hypothetical protein